MHKTPKPKRNRPTAKDPQTTTSQPTNEPLPSEQRNRITLPLDTSLISFLNPLVPLDENFHSDNTTNTLPTTTTPYQDSSSSSSTKKLYEERNSRLINPDVPTLQDEPDYFTAEEETERDKSKKETRTNPRLQSAPAPPPSPPPSLPRPPFPQTPQPHLCPSSPSPSFRGTNSNSDSEHEAMDSEHRFIDSDSEYDLDSEYEFVELKERLPEARNGGTGLRRERRRWWRWGRR